MRASGRSRVPKLTAGGFLGWFGSDVALSADGNTALIGATLDSNNIGAAWVYVRSVTGVWSPQGGKLTATGETGNGNFGWSVALSANGDLGLIGAPADNGGSGRAFWFARSGETWSQLSSSGVGTGAVGNARFGSSVAMSSNGSVALIGGNEDGNTGNSNKVGAAWLLTRSGNTWSQSSGKLTGGGEVGPAEFGYAAALSSDGNTALIGGHHDNTDMGAAWVFATTAPSQPTAVTATAGVEQASVSFAPPSSDGGAAITSYTVTSSPDGKTATGAGSPLVVTGLTGGVSYTFTVTAHNAVGDSAPSAASNAVVPTAPVAPGAPTGATATPSNTQASVAFTAPASDGGAAITSYTVTSSPDGKTATGATSPLVVTGLTNGTSYTFTVVAHNVAGDSAASAPSTAVTPRTVPGAPTAVAATPGNTQATVSFSAPASNGGAAVTSYTVTSSPDGKTATGATSPLVVTGLTNGTSYTFTVVAHNVAGDSAASAPSTAVTPRTVPGAPTAVTATPGNTQATVSFSAPASNGGAAVTSYTVTSSPDGKTATGATSPLVVTGLTNGTSYTFTVVAHNVVGDGAASAVSNAVVPGTTPVAPGAPTGVAATPGSGQASVTFTPPASDGGAGITSYTVTASPGGQTASGPAGPIVVAALSSGTSYTFTVTATNSAGTGPASSPSAPIVPLALGHPPSPPSPPGEQPRVPDPTPPQLSNPRVPPPHH